KAHLHFLYFLLLVNPGCPSTTRPFYRATWPNRSRNLLRGTAREYLWLRPLSDDWLLGRLGAVPAASKNWAGPIHPASARPTRRRRASDLSTARPAARNCHREPDW